jgi:hypothetical protein
MKLGYVGRAVSLFIVLHGIMSHAWGGLSYISQSRTVSVEANVWDTSYPGPSTSGGGDTAPGFGPWLGSAEASSDITGTDGAEYFSKSKCGQNSVLDPSGIVASGSFDISTNAYMSPMLGWGKAESILDVVFDVPVASHYTMAGFYKVNYKNVGINYPYAQVELVEVATATTVFDDSSIGNYNFSGLLNPGKYNARFSIGADMESPNAQGSYEWNLKVQPVPLPLALWSGLSGLAGIVALRRRSSAA